jgi:hypothetical protein
VTGGQSAAVKSIVDNIVENGKRGLRLACLYNPPDKGTGLYNYTTSVQLFYNTDSQGPLETVVEVTDADLQFGFAIRDVTMQGQEKVHEVLNRHAQQGFKLSATFDSPEVRRSGIVSAKTSIFCIMQRAPNASPVSPPATLPYFVMNIPIMTSGGVAGAQSSIPALIPTLQQHGARNYRLSGVYMPPLQANGGLFETKATCTLIFEHTTMQWKYHVCDLPIPVTANLMGGGNKMDPSQYLGFVEQGGAAGWEVAALIGLPGGQMTGMLSGTWFVRVVLRSPILISTEDAK